MPRAESAKKEISAKPGNVTCATFQFLDLIRPGYEEEGLEPLDYAYYDTDPSDHLEYEAALIYDSLLVLSSAVSALNNRYSANFLLDPRGKVSCQEEQPWEYGATLFNYINAVETHGMTGKLAFQVGIKKIFVVWPNFRCLCGRSKKSGEEAIFIADFNCLCSCPRPREPLWQFSDSAFRLNVLKTREAVGNMGRGKRMSRVPFRNYFHFLRHFSLSLGWEVRRRVRDRKDYLERA